MNDIYPDLETAKMLNPMMKWFMRFSAISALPIPYERWASS